MGADPATPDPAAATQDEPEKPNQRQEMMRYFQCGRGHRWLEPYAQSGTYQLIKPCIAMNCKDTVKFRHIVSATYWWPNNG